MAKDFPISDGLHRFEPRPVRPWRSWCWGASAWLRSGSIALAFFLALRTGTAGTLVLLAFAGGFLLQQVLEATSQGD